MSPLSEIEHLGGFIDDNHGERHKSIGCADGNSAHDELAETYTLLAGSFIQNHFAKGSVPAWKVIPQFINTDSAFYTNLYYNL